MPTLRIDTLYEGAWKLFGFQYEQLTSDRDRYVGRLQRRLGPEMAEAICQQVDMSLLRALPLADRRDPDIMTSPEYFELLGMEKTLADIERCVEANAIFYDPHHGLMRTLGLSWQKDIRPLIDGQRSPGYIPVENVQKLTALVLGAKQRIIGAEDDAKFYRQRRQELIQFLQRALLVGEPLFCDV
jgi:hypothetical protein